MRNRDNLAVDGIGFEVGAKALGWLVRHAPKLEEQVCEFGVAEATQTAVAELSLLVFLLASRCKGVVDAQLRLLTGILERVYDEALAEQVVRGSRKAFVGHLLVFLALETAGKDCPLPRAAIEDVVSCTDVGTWGLQPYRRVELQYLLDLGGFDHAIRWNPELLAQSVLELPFRPSWIEDAESYELTHLLSYLTDFGRKPERHLSRVRLEELARRCEFLFFMTASGGNIDLAIELLLAAWCTGVRNDRLHRIGWRFVAQCQTADGRFSAVREGFMSSYHPVLVAALGGILCGCHRDE